MPDAMNFKPDPMINNIETGSGRKQPYRPQPKPPTRKQLTGWTVEQGGLPPLRRGKALPELHRRLRLGI